MTGYLIAGILLLVIGAILWAFLAGRSAGKDKTLVGVDEDASKLREEGDAIMSEPVADEDSWLAAARKRLARMRQ